MLFNILFDPLYQLCSVQGYPSLHTNIFVLKVFMSAPLSNETQWNNHHTTVHTSVRDDIVAVGEHSLWLSVCHKESNDNSEGGMIHYNHKSDEIVNVIEYPSDLGGACSVGYGKNVYLIYGWGEKISGIGNFHFCSMLKSGTLLT